LKIYDEWMTKMESLSQKNVIGHIAYDWINAEDSAVVQGQTSGGTFLKLSGERVFFLTNSPSYGPLNFITPQKAAAGWELHSEINIMKKASQISFDHPLHPLILDSYDIWTIPMPPAYSIDPQEQSARLALAGQQLRLVKDGEGFSPLLTLLQGRPEQDLGSSLIGIWGAISAIKSAIISLNERALLQNTQKILGYGRGLTPSGDDFLSGLLFTLNRAGSDCIPAAWLADIQEQILEQARTRTNSVSRSLLYCAAQGSADSRVQELVDALINKETAFSNQALPLARWGNSSGLDLFVGIAIAFQSMQERRK
jgi:hypothetical protein